MLKSDDRFARQNRYGPPPGFPLASACSSIVHHLSGPNVYALPPRGQPAGQRCNFPRVCTLSLGSLGRRNSHRGWECARRPSAVRDPPSAQSRLSGVGLHSHFAFRFRRTLRLAHMLDSLVRVSRRVGRVASQSPLTLDRCVTEPGGNSRSRANSGGTGTMTSPHPGSPQANLRPEPTH